MEVPIVSVDPTMSDREIAEMMVGMDRYVRQKNKGFLLTVSGFDYDERGLHEIPAATAFMAKLMDKGLFSYLEVTTTLDIDCNPYAGGQHCPGLGAFEAWLIATGKFLEIMKPTGRHSASGEEIVQGEATQDTFQEFVYWLQHTSNPAAQVIVEQTLASGEVKDLIGSMLISKDGKMQVLDSTLTEFTHTITDDGSGKRAAPTGSQRIDPLFPLRRKSWGR